MPAMQHFVFLFFSFDVIEILALVFGVIMSTFKFFGSTYCYILNVILLFSSMSINKRYHTIQSTVLSDFWTF